jgi:hypothetical protein
MAMDPLSEQLIHPMRILCAEGSLQSQLLRLAASLGGRGGRRSCSHG